MKKIVLTILFFLVACYGREILACSCVSPPGGPTYIYHKDRLKNYVSNPAFAADTIFLGTVTQIEPRRVAEGFHPGNMAAVTFSIEKVWADGRKDPDDPSVITIQTNESDGMCGVIFKQGGRYFVFAKNLETNYCMATGEYREGEVAADYYKVLGGGREPSKRGSQKSTPPEQKPPA